MIAKHELETRHLHAGGLHAEDPKKRESGTVNKVRDSVASARDRLEAIALSDGLVSTTAGAPKRDTIARLAVGRCGWHACDTEAHVQSVSPRPQQWQQHSTRMTDHVWLSSCSPARKPRKADDPRICLVVPECFCHHTLPTSPPNPIKTDQFLAGS